MADEPNSTGIADMLQGLTRSIDGEAMDLRVEAERVMDIAGAFNVYSDELSAPIRADIAECGPELLDAIGRQRVAMQDRLEALRVLGTALWMHMPRDRAAGKD